MTTIEMLGVFETPACEPVHLIEMLVHESRGPFKIGTITQQWLGKERDSWQVAYDEKILTPDGADILFDPWFPEGDVSQHWIGDVRFAFFFHYLNFDTKLMTPFGNVAVIDVGMLPKRLKFMKYESPC
ncbi:hypothetical protein [Novipirellula sp.]|uniref:hypothetical protein n=1 Tax=Novipirellula sp. TaxID=2795430 RepID=UPI003562645D